MGNGQEFENDKFLAVFNCSSYAEREKDKSNYHFCSDKEGSKPSKVRREKWLAQILSKDLTERKLERTRMKIVLSSSPSSVFSHKVCTISDLKSKYIFYPN